MDHLLHDPAAFRAALLAVEPRARDDWFDRLLGLREIPDDGADLPRGCVPYIPSPADALLRMVDEARVTSADVFVDIGSGLGRTAAFVHLITGAEVVGVEVQAGLVDAARDLVSRLHLSRISFVQGDAGTAQSDSLTRGTVFFLYCPFSGERLAKVLTDLEVVASTRPIRVCTLDLPALSCSGLTLQPAPAGDLAIYES